MFTSFSFGSSTATLPSSMSCCDNLGIQRKIYTFSIPLGATINMDGNCIILMVTAFFMAKTFSVDITSSLLFALVITIMSLSVGAPGVPGGNLVCIAMLLPIIGIPADAVSLVVGFYNLTGMIMSCTNVTGDAVVTTLIAKSEKALDVEKYNS